MVPFLPSSALGPDPFLTPPAIERGGGTFGCANASQNWRNSVNEARGNMITSASQGGIFMSSSQPSSSQEVGSYQAQLDSSDNKFRTRNLLESVPGVRHAAVR